MSDGLPATFKPLRVDGLRRELDDELLLYNSESHRAHCLNKSASVVWLACDGKSTVSQIATVLSSQVNRQVDESEVWFALANLHKAGLLANGGELFRKARPQSRRSILRKLGVAAVASLPVVTSMLVPPPAAGASCFPLLHTCSTGAQCCSGRCGLSGIKLVCLP